MLFNQYCVYCGDFAYLSVVVPACHDCNCRILRDYNVSDVRRRRALVLSMLVKRHEAMMKEFPEWTEEELQELSGTLRRHAQVLLNQRTVLEARIEFAKFAQLSPKQQKEAKLCLTSDRPTE